MRVNATALFFPKLRTDFWDTYRANETQVDARLAKVLKITGSTMASEAYGYGQAAPVARFWDEGNAIPSSGMLTNLFLQRNYKFGIGVEIEQTAIEDDQSKMIMARVMESAASFAMLKERHFYWVLTGGTTSDAVQMQPNLPLAPDGAALFSATDGAGNARFGLTGGNIQGTSGVGSAVAIINDLMNGIARIARFLNTEGQPYWNPSDIQREVAIIFNAANWPNFKAALNQMFVVAASGNAAPSNLVIDADLKVVPIPNPRITNNNWSIHATSTSEKAVFWQERVAPKEVMAEPGNSDTAREWDIFKLYVRSRGAVGVALPTMVVGVQ
jgi:phage major head subunit gpT-like protein